jgi:uncharacterized OB-fold protein
MRPRHWSLWSDAGKANVVAKSFFRLLHKRFPAATRSLRRTVEALRDRFQKALQCSQCGQHVALFAELCPHCGAGNPVRVSRSSSVLLAAVVCAIGALLFCLH